ncbi:MAG: LPXTG cell wall anchor domain-containing protein, partial [Chloroflexota bacterium]
QAAQTFSVRLSNFTIAGAPSQVRAGAPLAFNATASGFPHNLAIDGNGVDLHPSTANLMDGQSGTISFPALQPGTYSLYCPVGRHRAQGMEVQFTVVAAAPAAPRGGTVRLPATGGFSVPAGLALAGLASGAAGIALRRRKA